MEANEKDLAMAAKIMDTICAMIEDEELHYDRDDEKFMVHLEFSSDDFPLKIVFKVFPERQLVIVYSPLTFNIPESGRTDVALAMTILNCCLYDGVWTLDLSNGEADFRITNSYYDSILGKACFKDLMSTALRVNSTTADKLFMLGKGNMTLQQFTETVLGK